jgi:hypothetical protein
LSRLEVRDFWDRLLNDKRYWPNLRRRFDQGKAQHLETYLWAMRFGKPTSKIEITRRDESDESVIRYLTRNEQAQWFLLYQRAEARRTGKSPWPLPVAGTVVEVKQPAALPAPEPDPYVEVRRALERAERSMGPKRPRRAQGAVEATGSRSLQSASGRLVAAEDDE